MLSTIVEALSFSFFQRALLVGSLIGLIYSQLGNLVVIRQETVISHSISNFAFLGVAIAMLFDANINSFSFAIAVLGALIIAWLQRNQILSKDSTLTFSSQAAMAAAIIIISLLEGYRVNILQFLFGNILAISQQDIILTLLVGGAVLVALILGRRSMLRLALNKELAIVHGDKAQILNIAYLILLALAIAVGIKTVGVILIAAFLVIPANIAKLTAKSYTQMQFLSAVYSFSGVIIGLFLSYLLDIPSGASIVAVLSIGLIISSFDKLRK